MINKIKRYCRECNGEGNVSRCCNDNIDNRKCLNCGKFCANTSCDYCYGYGYIDYHINDNVEIFVSYYSKKYLHDILYKPKNCFDSKLFNGVIKEFKDLDYASVEINDKLFQIKIDDLEIR